MLDNERWDNVAERVSTNDFFNRAHRLIFNEMQRLLEMSKPIDLITLSESLEQKRRAGIRRRVRLPGGNGEKHPQRGEYRRLC
ncbi:hypothetical protein OS42_33210 [Dickeya oryzae]